MSNALACGCDPAINYINPDCPEGHGHAAQVGAAYDKCRNCQARRAWAPVRCWGGKAHDFPVTEGVTHGTGVPRP